MSARPATDWDAYYSRPFPAAHLTRRYTVAAVGAQVARLDLPASPSVVELGGGGSCVHASLRRRLQPSRYHVVDRNRRGLDLLRAMAGDDPALALERADLLDWRPVPGADLALSIGLVEHFDAAGTARVVAAHLDCLRPGGYAVLFFPTPTRLYRLVRSAAERLGVWGFPDERPLGLAEVRDALVGADLLRSDLHWATVLTQRSVVARKR